MFEKIKGYFDGGLWSIGRVWNVVGKAITGDEYREITGCVWPKKEAEAGGEDAVNTPLEEESE